MSAEEKSVSELSTNAKYIVRLCKMIIKDIRNGKCAEEQINDILINATPLNNGYINPKDYLNADNAMKYLGVHRKEFFALKKKHNVCTHKINNHPIGYHINDLKRIRKAEGL